MNRTFSRAYAKDVMNSYPPVVSEGTRLGRSLARQLLSGLFSGFPVVDANGEIQGMVTDGGLFKAIREGKDLSQMNAEEVMTVPFACVDEFASLEKVYELMVRKKLKQIPVVRNHKLVGVIGRHHLMQFLLNEPNPDSSEVSSCYWCERINDPHHSQPILEQWVTLTDYFNNQLDAVSGVKITPTFCPSCWEIKQQLMGKWQNSPFAGKIRTSRSKRILIVEDDLSVATPLSEFLQSLGYETLLATNGWKGLEMVEAQSVDGILLDLEMPGIDGWTMLDELRWRHHTMPVILMSGEANHGCLQNLMNEGAQGYLVKPFDLPSVENICRKIFGDIPSPPPELRTAEPQPNSYHQTVDIQ